MLRQHNACLQAARLVEHGYVRRYMRSLQIADVVNSMTDLMHMSQREPSPIAALQQFHMAMASQQQNQSPDSLQSMPTVTSAGLQTSPDESKQQQQQQSKSHQQPQPQHQQRQHQQQHQPQQQPSQSMPPALQHSNQLNSLRQTLTQSDGPAQSNGHNGTSQALISPRHSSRSGPNPFAQQTQSSGRPPTPRGARR